VIPLSDTNMIHVIVVSDTIPAGSCSNERDDVIGCTIRAVATQDINKSNQTHNAPPMMWLNCTLSTDACDAIRGLYMC